MAWQGLSVALLCVNGLGLVWLVLAGPGQPTVGEARHSMAPRSVHCRVYLCSMGMLINPPCQAVGSSGKAPWLRQGETWLGLAGCGMVRLGWKPRCGVA